LARNEIFYGNPKFIEAYQKLKEERTDSEQIISAAFNAIERLRTYIHDSDWQPLAILSVLQKQSKHVYHLAIGYESFIVSLHVEKTKDANTPFLITLLTIGPGES